MSKSSLWRHPVVEGFAVLVGILIAFGLQAWWQVRSERATEQSYLEALAGELQDARSYFAARDQDLAEDIQLAEAVRRALNSRAAATISDDSVNALAMQLGPSSVDTPPRAALDDLVASGGIGLVQSGTLRREIAAYVQALAVDLRAQDAAVDLWLTHLAPYRYDHSTLIIATPLVDRPDLPVTVDRDAYVRAREYMNFLTARVLRDSDVRMSHQAASAQVERLTSLLDSLGIGATQP